MRRILPYPDIFPLCIKHDKPILKSQWKHGSRTTGCSSCRTVHRASEKTKERRNKLWKSTFISCSKHPNKRCNRSLYVGGRRLCLSCRRRKLDGTLKPSFRNCRARKDRIRHKTFRGRQLKKNKDKRAAQRKYLGWAASLQYSGQRKQIFN